jgi:hypothetical protein
LITGFHATTISDCSDIFKEYWSHVASQAELPIAGASPTGKLVTELTSLANLIVAAKSPQDAVTTLANQLYAEPNLIHDIRTLVSVSDKRLYLDLSYVFSRIVGPNGITLCGCAPHNLAKHSVGFFVRKVSVGTDAVRREASKAIAKYFLDKGLANILRVYCSMTVQDRAVITESLIDPREAQQNQAKRRGHGAEAAVAGVVQSLHINFTPPDKATNPMGAHDPNVNLRTMAIERRSAGTTTSFDIVLTDKGGALRAFVQGLVQSSDPGQFGVNKSNETVEIRRALDEYNKTNANQPRVEVWGIVDGVGYSENKEGTVNKMLTAFHEFFQMKSLYKVGLAAHRLGLCSIKAIKFNDDFYTAAAISHMSRYVPPGVTILSANSSAPAATTELVAGKASLFV